MKLAQSCLSLLDSKLCMVLCVSSALIARDIIYVRVEGKVVPKMISHTDEFCYFLLYTQNCFSIKILECRIEHKIVARGTIDRA